MGSDYSKYKDNDPRDTVFRIQNILNRAGLFTVMDWVDNESEGAFANRVKLYPSEIGTNGKGTDRLYASASGYAELMERIQNFMFSMSTLRPRIAEHGDFVVFPDEKAVSVEEAAEQGDEFLRYVFGRNGCIIPAAGQLFLRNYAGSIEKRNDGMITTVPFADISCGKVVYLPLFVVNSACGSNGMAAGNTIEEAIVQGMCEVYERYVNRMMLTGEAVPPEIPEDELKKYSIWNLIEEIEGDGRYHISVRDCSLGKGYPVAASIITDRHKGTFGVKLGAHPSLAVAVERTLTEALQGRNVDNICSVNMYGSKEQAEAYHNIPNIMKINVGVYPVTLLSGEPGWEYRPWTEWEGGSNREFVAQMISMAERDGWHMYIRDNSHMGFPAVQIVVPGCSEMYEVGRTHYRAMMTISRAHDAFSHFPYITEEEENDILRIIRFTEISAIENTPGAIAGRPVTDGRLDTCRIAAFIAFKRGEYAVAEHFFSVYAEHYCTDEESTYYRAMAHWCRVRAMGVDDKGAFNLVSVLFGEEQASRIRNEAADPDGILKRNFPVMNCFDCENCELSGKGCDNMVEEEIIIRIKDAMKDSKVSQKDLLDRLSSL